MQGLPEDFLVQKVACLKYVGTRPLRLFGCATAFWQTKVLILHRVSKKLCKIVFVRTSSNFHQFS